MQTDSEVRQAPRGFPGICLGMFAFCMYNGVQRSENTLKYGIIIIIQLKQRMETHDHNEDISQAGI